jgi:hypothetical protein
VSSFLLHLLRGAERVPPYHSSCGCSWCSVLFLLRTRMKQIRFGIRTICVYVRAHICTYSHMWGWLTRRGQYSAIAILHTLQFTATHTHTHTHKGSQCSVVVSWQRIYNSSRFLCCQARILAGCRLETLLSSPWFWLCPYITPRHRPHRKQPLLLRRCVCLFVA